MCGRYYQISDPSLLAKIFGTANAVPNVQPHYNAAPTQDLPVLRFNPETRTRSLDLLRWGLVPHWPKDPSVGSKLLKARAEGIATRTALRDAFPPRRAPVPADRPPA